MLITILALSGCRTEYSTFRPSLDLTVTLEDPTPTAGDEVAYLAYMDGSSEPLALDGDLYMVSSHEEGILWDELAVNPTIAGQHDLTFSTMFEGELYTTTVEMQVAAGAPTRIDLQLADLQVDAGELLEFGVRAWDAYDNETPTTHVEVTTDSDIDGNVMWSTVPGTYTATAADSNTGDTEEFLVVPGPAVGLDLELSRTNLEVAETAIATVTIVDEYGNVAGDEPWDLWVDPAPDVDVNFNALTFWAEGNYTVYAATLDGAFSDSVGPFLIDSNGPDLEVLIPERGTQTTVSGQYTSGTVYEEWSGVSSLTVNGETATVNSDLTWEAWSDYDYGMTVLETLAIDGDGNRTTDTRAVLSGSYNGYGYGVGDGIEVRITESGFDTIEDLVGDFVNTDLLESALPNPVFEDSSESCIWSLCITWYSIYFTVSNPSIGSTGLDIDPTSGGYLDTEAVVYNPHLDFNASGKLLGISYSQSGSIDADWISLGMEMTPYVSSGLIGVDIANASVDEQNFDFDLDGWLWDIIDFFGIPVDALLWSLMEGLMEDLIESEVPDLLEDVLADLEIAQSFDVEGNTYHFDAVPYSVPVDDLGLTLGLETYFTADTWVNPYTDSPGSLAYPYTAPTYGSTTNAMILGLSQDFLNQAFHALWAGGLLEQEMPAEELGLDLGDLGDALPFSELAVGISAFQPPVVVPGTGDSLLDLQIGDLEISLYDGDIAESNLFMRFYVTVEAGLELGTTSDNTLSAGLGESSIKFDLVYPNERSMQAEGVENFLTTIVDTLLPSLTDALGEFAIPDIEGFTLDNVTIELDGAEDGYVTAGGDLSVN
ncbi:MAG: hypothetical protein GY913_18030 [Proteobacteria bacterium]|nr:hypothetical protein [Pseudomonadota bacterium]MCP4918807.1 hypothetical protein [Pseudomonadota bacterium]